LDSFLKDKTTRSPTVDVHRLRLIKSPAEQEMMKKAGAISAQAFREAMKRSKYLQTEHQLDAIFEYEVRMRGAQRLAYPPVIASGIRNNTLHYIQNDNILEKGDLILSDAGADYFYYTADITRTWPVSGKFSLAQKTVYEEVLNVQYGCLEFLKDSLKEQKQVSLSDVHRESRRLMTIALKNLKIPAKKLDVLYPHSIGHFLGMDTHDTPTVTSHTSLKPGMIVTVEPGLYIPHEDDIHPDFRGIGVRIEDDVLITPSGHFILSKDTPKEVSEIESLM